MTRWVATLAAGVVTLVSAALAAPPSNAPATSRSMLQDVTQQDSTHAASPATTSGGRSHKGARHIVESDNILRGGDTSSLIAMLPWWRVDDSHPPDQVELESPILTACDVWLGFPYATPDAQSLTVRLASEQEANDADRAAYKIPVASPDELNVIDLTAPPQQQPPSTSWGGGWLSGLLALLGGAVAAFSAVRYLVA